MVATRSKSTTRSCSLHPLIPTFSLTICPTLKWLQSSHSVQPAPSDHRLTNINTVACTLRTQSVPQIKQFLMTRLPQRGRLSPNSTPSKKLPRADTFWQLRLHPASELTGCDGRRSSNHSRRPTRLCCCSITANLRLHLPAIHMPFNQPQSPLVLSVIQTCGIATQGSASPCLDG